MPKKEKEKESSSSILEMLKSIAVSSVTDYVKGVMSDIHDLVEYVAKRALQILYATALFMVGLLFLCIAAVLLIRQYLHLSIGWSFMVMGLILIIAAILIKNKALNDINERRK